FKLPRLAEVSLQKTLECFAVTSLISCHLVYCIVDCVKVGSFRTLCKIKLSCCSAVLSVNTHLKVLLCAVCYDFAKELCEFSSVLSFLVSSFLVVQTDLRISFSVGNSCHCKIHTNLRALALEVCSQISKDVLAYALCNTYN